MEGTPNEWKVCVSVEKGYFFESGETSIIAFLESLLSGRSPLIDEAIAGVWLESPRFVPDS